MLQLSGYLINRPVLSLRSGKQVAWTTGPIINPEKLNIEGFYVQDTASKNQLVLLCQDVRELNIHGYIIDDHDVLAQPEDLIRLQPILNLQFTLPGKNIETTNREKIGKVSDYAVELTTMYIQKLYASRSIWKSLTTGSLSIDRSQIVEVTNHRIVINDLLQPVSNTVAAVAN